MSDEIPGVDDYLTLLDKASQVPWKHDELFKEAGDEHGTGDRDSTDPCDNG